MFGFIRRCLLVFACSTSFVCFSQDTTKVLEEVEIVGIDLSKFSSGTTLVTIKYSEGGSLSNIEDQSSVYFKNYGSGQLSTISLRGTSASHTNVIWNGISVNSPTLGQTDFSVWPMFLTNQISIQKGGGSSLFGSGAIGGTVIIDNSQISKDSLVSFFIGLGSFGQRDAGIKVQLHSDNLTNETKLYGSELENDFELENGSRQEHASVARLAVSNRLNYQYKKGRLFTEVAYAENDREIQPTRTSASRSTLESRNVRGVVNNILESNATHHSTIGFISDQTLFNDSSSTHSYRLSATHAVESGLNDWLFVRYGATGIHEWATSENLIATEKQTQGHLFVSGTFSDTRGSLTLNLRQAFFETNRVFVPSIGVESRAFRNGSIQGSLRAQLSRDYRVPTFNDLFWQPGGNLSLNPERSLNYEAGADITISRLSISVTAFTSSISDWIQWTPNDGIWSPQNIREVETKGIEINSNLDFNIQNRVLSFIGEYSYTRSKDKGVMEDNQLPYVPKHSAMASASLVSRKSIIELIANYTGKRFTTLSNSVANSVDDFLLVDTRFSYDLRLSAVQINAAVSVRNIANVNYENLKNTAMPGRAFLIEITTKI